MCCYGNRLNSFSKWTMQGKSILHSHRPPKGMLVLLGLVILIKHGNNINEPQQ